MANKDTFSGAKAAFTMFDAYVNTVAQDIGMERAIGLLTKTWEKIEAMQGKRMKEQSGINEVDAKKAWSLLKTPLAQSYGIIVKMAEETPKKAVGRVGKCPIYEAAQALGMDAATIEARCRASSIIGMDAVVKQLNPALSLRLKKFRSAADDFCEEEVVLG